MGFLIIRRTNEPRRTTLARDRTVLLLSHVQIVAAGQTVPAAPWGHLLFDRLQQRRTADGDRDLGSRRHRVSDAAGIVATTGIGNGCGCRGFRRASRFDPRAASSSSPAAAAAAATAGVDRTRLSDHRRQTDDDDDDRGDDQRNRVGFSYGFREFNDSTTDERRANSARTRFSSRVELPDQYYVYGRVTASRSLGERVEYRKYF